MKVRADYLSLFVAAVGLAQSVGAQVVINEVFENPPNGGDQSWEYIELYGPPGFNLTGYAVALVKGGIDEDFPHEIPDGSNNQKGPEIDEAFSLDGWSIGPNGMFVIYNVTEANAGAVGPFLIPNPNWGFPFNETPTHKRYLNGASFRTLHIPSVDITNKLENDGSSTYMIVRRRPNHSLNTNGMSVYAPGYVWKKDASPDVDFNSYLDFGNEDTLGVPIYLAEGLDFTQTGSLQMQPVQIVDEIAWSNAGGKEFNFPGLGDRSGKLLETPGFNPDLIARLRYLAQNPHIGWSVNANTGELERTSIADESWAYGEVRNVDPGTPTYGWFKRLYENGTGLGTNTNPGQSVDQLNYRAPTNPTGPTYSYDGPGDDNPLQAPFFGASGSLDTLGTLIFEPYDLTDFRITPGTFNDAPAGTPLASTALAQQFRFVRGDFNFDGVVDCLDRGLIARAATEGWTLDDTGMFINDRNNQDVNDDTSYIGYTRQLSGFNATLAMIRMNLTDGSTGEWNSNQIIDTTPASPTFNRIIAWGGAVTAQDLAKFDTEFPALAGTACGAAPTGACCTATLCSVVTLVECLGNYLGDNTVCENNTCIPLPEPTGACCTGAACEIIAEADCLGIYLGTDSVCGDAGSPSLCCPADFNGDATRDVADLFAYINAWLAKTSNADFNDDDAVDVADLFAYINAWLAGC